jgi:putative sigma-54 modulation protein
MNINFEYHEVSASQRLEGLVGEKLIKLESKYDAIVAADVYFKKENSSNPEKGKICSVRLSMPGANIFAESSTASLEASIAKVVTELGSQLQKRKEKLKAH